MFYFIKLHVRGIVAYSWFYMALAVSVPLNIGDNLTLEGEVWDFSTVSELVSVVSN